MALRRSILVLVVVAAFAAGPLAPAFTGCLHQASACDAACSVGGLAGAPAGGGAISLDPAGRAPERPTARPHVPVLAVPTPPPKATSPVV